MPSDIPGTTGFTNGAYQIPDDRDRGNTVFQTLEDFMNRMATHGHTGADSKTIALNIAKDQTEFLVGVNEVNWTLLTNGLYRGIVAVPAATTYDLSIRKYFTRKRATIDPWVEFYPTVNKINDSSYYMFTNSNDIEIKVVTL